jgi:hypothetical protein
MSSLKILFDAAIAAAYPQGEMIDDCTYTDIITLG